ncbi:MAG: hypothetical protein HRF49_06040 [bacterium]
MVKIIGAFLFVYTVATVAFLLTACPAQQPEDTEMTPPPASDSMGGGDSAAPPDDTAKAGAETADDGEDADNGEGGNEAGEGTADDEDEGEGAKNEKIIDGEVIAFDAAAKTIQVKYAEGGVEKISTLALAENYDKCPKCGMTKTFAAGDRASYILHTLPDGKLEFAGINCTGEGCGDEESCANCPHHKKEGSAKGA